MSIIMLAQGKSSTFLLILYSREILASQIYFGNYERNKTDLYKVFEVLLLKILYV